jgi:hypothetical protein
MAVQPEDEHPITDNPVGVPLEQQLREARHLLAELWDQVWWLSLPPERRAEYESQGFTAPIQKFYGRGV